MSAVIINGDTSGSVTLQAPAVAGSTTLTLPATSGTVIVNSGAQTIEFADGSAGAPSITNSGDTNTGMFFPAADTIAFAEGGTEAMRIDSSGNVGIGTSSPTTKLQIGATGGSVSGAASAGYLSIRKPIDSTSSPWGTRMIDFYGYYPGFESANPSATIISGCNAAASTEYGYLAFGTAFNAAPVERMRLDEYGNLLVGTTSSTPTGTNNSIIIRPGLASYFSLASNNCVSFNRYTTSGIVVNIDYAGATVGNISTNGSNCTFNSTSDYRLKENIAPLTGALNRISALKPVTYKWKQDQQDGEGFIAHELAEVCPEAVTGKKDEVNEEGKPVYQSIDQSFLIATLTAALQEQQTIINDIKTELDNVKTELATLKGAA
jgi:hypothetical protein